MRKNPRDEIRTKIWQVINYPGKRHLTGEDKREKDKKGAFLYMADTRIKKEFLKGEWGVHKTRTKDQIKDNGDLLQPFNSYKVAVAICSERLGFCPGSRPDSMVCKDRDVGPHHSGDYGRHHLRLNILCHLQKLPRDLHIQQTPTTKTTNKPFINRLMNRLQHYIQY